MRKNNKKIKIQLINNFTLNDYLNWYKNKYAKCNDIHENGISIFYMPFEFQIGIIIKFAEKVGYRISIKYNQKSNWTYEVVHGDFVSTNTTEIKSYKKACKLAILEFNKRYNNTWESI